jgi:predicted DNA-binding transcriptional regulator YafY
MAEHIYMFSGESQMVSFRADKKIVTDIIDWFGTEVIFTDETEFEVTATVCVNLMAMRYWLLQYSRYVKVLRPSVLVENVKDDLRSALRKYE